MIASKRAWLAAAWTVAFVCNGPARVAAQAADESSSVNALILIDDLDSKIGKSVAKDRDLMKRILEQGFKNSGIKDFKLNVLDGQNSTSRGVFDYYDKLPIEPNATLFLYYSGHGGYDPKLGNFLGLQSGKSILLRSQVLAMMQEKKPRLIVLLTDCCNSFCPLRPSRSAKDLQPNWATMRCLLLGHRGVVDLNAAAEGEISLTGQEASVFTLPLVEVFCALLQALDSNKDGFVHWQEVLPKLQKTTQDDYGQIRKRFLDEYKKLPGDDKEEYKDLYNRFDQQVHQTVRSYSLPPSWRFGVCVGDDGDGARISEVFDYTGAAAAGLQAGDVIREIDGKTVKNASDFSKSLAGIDKNKIVKVTYLRLTKENEMEVRFAPWRSGGKVME